MKDKPRGKPPTTAQGTDPGKLAVDDRGNITWEWQDEDELLADDELGSAARIRALVDPSLEIKDDEGRAGRLRSNPAGLKSGYNPYNSGTLGTRPRGKKKDLKQLSQWIELRKKLTQGKDGA